MAPDDFPPLRVILYDGCYWSVDNRRLWVFRLARCSRISVHLLSRMHPRLEELIASSHLMLMMRADDFFPKVRDRGQKDWDFDRRFPEPSSSNRSRHEAANIFPGVRDGAPMGWNFDRLFADPSSFQQVVNEGLTRRPIDSAEGLRNDNHSPPNNRKQDHEMDQEKSGTASPAATTVGAKITEAVWNFFAYVKKSVFGGGWIFRVWQNVRSCRWCLQSESFLDTWRKGRVIDFGFLGSGYSAGFLTESAHYGSN